MSPRRTFVYSLVTALLLLLAGCGSGHRSSRPLAPPSASNLTAPTPKACKPGLGHMGCSVPHQYGVNFKQVKLPANQGLIPDVYEGDSIYSWAQAKPHIVGAIVKAWEYRQDQQLASNWRQLSALHIWHTAYLFLHNCSEAAPFVNAVNSQGGFNQPYTGPPVVDAEVPEAGPALGCTVATIENMTHRQVIEYTSPGSNPGGNRGDAYEWAAGYGNYSHCPFVWTGNCIAWQYTDGTYGPYPHQIPGIQPGDISVSYGMQNLVFNPPNPYLVFTNVVYDLGHGIKAAEQPVVEGWDKWQCTLPTARANHPKICGYLHYRLALLDGRLKAVANSSRPPDWSTGHRYRRAKYIEAQLAQKKGPWVGP